MRTGLKYCLAVILVTAAASSALAQVKVTDAWVRATVARQSATGAFMRLDSPTDARLIAVTTPVAGAVEMHRMSMAGDVMRMSPVSGIDIPGGKGVSLQPGGYHLMLINLKTQIEAGAMIPLTLVIEDQYHRRMSVEVRATARPLNAGNAK